MDYEEGLRAALADRYRIEGEIGSGGMATVYLAEDLKHHRKVALKVLNPALSAVMGAERFLAEIETTANLQHPNILPLFDSGEADGLLFYVMPFVEGESLRKKLSREKQLSVSEAVSIATDVAEALQAAHDQGVIHRDIKPANILLSSGKPLVADFGIALAVREAGGGRLTETGLSLGSPHYMSPEQVSADHNPTQSSDVYSLGCVLYEMLLGEPPFTGATAQAVFAKILTEEPAHPTDQRKTIPRHVDAAVRRSLEKLPADRFRTAKEFAGALADPTFRHHGPLAGEARVGMDGRWKRITGVLAITTLVSLLALAWSSRQPEESGGVERFSLVIPEMWDSDELFSVSSDGRTIVFSGRVGTSQQLFQRRLDNLVASPIPGTEDGYYPAISPEAEEVAFVHVPSERLLVAPLAGGSTRTLAGSALCCVTWGWDGFIYFTSATDRVISRVPVGGGEVEDITRRSEGGPAHGFFRPLPGGEAGLFGVASDPPHIEALDFSTGESTIVLEGGGLAFPMPEGYVMFAQDDGRVLMGPVEAETGEMTGPPLTVIEGVRLGRRSFPLFSVSESGSVLYLSGSAPPSGYEFVWMNRSGVPSPVDPGWTFEPTTNRHWDLSPDGARLALKESTAFGADIWLRDLPDGPHSRLTYYEGEDRYPRWSADGSRITFLSDRAGNLDVWSKRSDGVGEAELVFDHDANLAEAFWSPQGDWLIVRTGGVGGVEGGRDILGLREGAEDGPVPLVAEEPFDEANPDLSPDGRWLAYHSTETGRKEVFLRSFPNTLAGKVQVSVGGGYSPVWAHSGEELFYVAGEYESVLGGDRTLMSARIRGEDAPVVMERQALFSIPEGYYIGDQTRGFEVTEDDQQFLMIRLAGTDEEGQQSELILIQNFFDEVKARLEGR